MSLQGPDFFLRDKRLFEITEVEITRVDCTLEQLSLLMDPTGGSIKGCTCHCSSHKAEANFVENNVFLGPNMTLTCSPFYVYEALTLTAKLDKRTRAFEM